VLQTAAASDGHRDQDIVELLRAGEQASAFERVCERYEQKVYRLCCSILRNTDQAEDAAQESLVRVWRALPKYDARASLSTWIYTITRNRCLTAIERRRDLESLSDAGVALEADGMAPTGADGGEDHSQRLAGLVAELPERYRQALTLFYYQERSVAEVASMLGQPEGTVKTNLHRARALLLERLRALGLGDPQAWLEARA
jgi:RNA polymerase sigma-70 factor (ECF subfamily)